MGCKCMWLVCGELELGGNACELMERDWECTAQRMEKGLSGVCNCMC